MSAGEQVLRCVCDSGMLDARSAAVLGEVSRSASASAELAWRHAFAHRCRVWLDRPNARLPPELADTGRRSIDVVGLETPKLSAWVRMTDAAGFADLPPLTAKNTSWRERWTILGLLCVMLLRKCVFMLRVVPMEIPNMMAYLSMNAADAERIRNEAYEQAARAKAERELAAGITPEPPLAKVGTFAKSVEGHMFDRHIETAVASALMDSLVDHPQRVWAVNELLAPLRQLTARRLRAPKGGRTGWQPKLWPEDVGLACDSHGYDAVCTCYKQLPLCCVYQPDGFVSSLLNQLVITPCFDWRASGAVTETLANAMAGERWASQVEEQQEQYWKRKGPGPNRGNTDVLVRRAHVAHGGLEEAARLVFSTCRRVADRSGNRGWCRMDPLSGVALCKGIRRAARNPATLQTAVDHRLGFGGSPVAIEYHRPIIAALTLATGIRPSPTPANPVFATPRIALQSEEPDLANPRASDNAVSICTERKIEPKRWHVKPTAPSAVTIDSISDTENVDVLHTPPPPSADAALAAPNGSDGKQTDGKHTDSSDRTNADSKGDSKGDNLANVEWYVVNQSSDSKASVPDGKLAEQPLPAVPEDHLGGADGWARRQDRAKRRLAKRLEDLSRQDMEAALCDLGTVDGWWQLLARGRSEAIEVVERLRDLLPDRLPPLETSGDGCCNSEDDVFNVLMAKTTAGHINVMWRRFLSTETILDDEESWPTLHTSVIEMRAKCLAAIRDNSLSDDVRLRAALAFQLLLPLSERAQPDPFSLLLPPRDANALPPTGTSASKGSSDYQKADEKGDEKGGGHEKGHEQNPVTRLEAESRRWLKELGMRVKMGPHLAALQDAGLWPPPCLQRAVSNMSSTSPAYPPSSSSSSSSSSPASLGPASLGPTSSERLSVSSSEPGTTVSSAEILRWAVHTYPLSAETAAAGWLLVQRVDQDRFSPWRYGAMSPDGPLSSVPIIPAIHRDQSADGSARLVKELASLEMRPYSTAHWRVLPHCSASQSDMTGWASYTRTYVLLRDEHGEETKLRAKFAKENRRAGGDSQPPSEQKAFDQSRWTFFRALVIDVSDDAPAVRIRGSWRTLTSYHYQDWHRLLRLECKPYDKERLPTLAEATGAVVAACAKVGLAIPTEAQLVVRLPGLCCPRDPENTHDTDSDTDTDCGNDIHNRSTHRNPAIGADILFREREDYLVNEDDSEP